MGTKCPLPAAMLAYCSHLHHCQWSADSAVFSHHNKDAPVASTSIYLLQPGLQHRFDEVGIGLAKELVCMRETGREFVCKTARVQAFQRVRMEQDI